MIADAIDVNIPNNLGCLFDDFDFNCPIVEYNDSCIINYNMNTAVGQTDGLVARDEFERSNTSDPLIHRLAEQRGEAERTRSRSQYELTDAMCMAEGF